jgi:hypothetical protein
VERERNIPTPIFFSLKIRKIFSEEHPLTVSVVLFLLFQDIFPLGCFSLDFPNHVLTQDVPKLLRIPTEVGEVPYLEGNGCR